jgi:hypothetical protein
MKKLMGIILIAGFGIFASSCTKEETPNTTTNANTSNTIQNGTWRITYYYDTDHDATSSFNSFDFTFASNGSVNAFNGLTMINGTWATGTDDSQVKLILNFSAIPPFDEIYGDWHVIELLSNKVRLEDVSGGLSGTDYLTFEKN